MKFRVTMKDPDPYDYIRALEDIDFVKRWLLCGERVVIEFDTEAETARLLTVEEASKPLKKI